MGKPYDALVLEFILAFGLWAPFSFFGSRIAGIVGIYWGISAANIVAGRNRVGGGLAESLKIKWHK